MTPRRQQVFDRLSECEDKGERLTLTELAKRCNLYDYRHARRLVRDLISMGLLGL